MWTLEFIMSNVYLIIWVVS